MKCPDRLLTHLTSKAPYVKDLGEAKAAADVSSPDLGVDVSLDPLSSLKRGRRQQQQQHQHPSDPQPAPFAEGQS